MQKAKEQDIEREHVTFNDFAPKLFERMFLFGKRIECIIWTFPNNQETAFGKTKVKLDAQEFEYHGKRYNMDHNKVQNRLGILTYNTEANDADGGLSYIREKSHQKIDAKNNKEVLQRNWLTALWGQWKMPFMIMLIAMGCALVFGILSFVFAMQWKDVGAKLESTTARLENSNACLVNIECMKENLDRLGADTSSLRPLEGDVIPPPQP